MCFASRMKLYADLPGRRAAQILTDLGVIAWVYLWARVGIFVRDATLELAAPGRGLQDAGSSYADQIEAAARQAGRVPIVGDDLQVPFRSLEGIGVQIEEAGTQLVDAVEQAATILGWVTALIPISIVVLTWVLVRGLFVRRATAAQRFIDGAPDLDLFALRAMANQPMTRLARVSADPAGAWRAGDPEVIRALATLELRSAGLRPPPVGRLGRGGPELSRG